MNGATNDPFQLQRFIDAQVGVYERALAELQAGSKRTHWMWFIFPQLDGLGHSATAQFYGIKGLDEARAYVAHPTLGPRLHECVAAILAVDGRTAHDVFGSPDDLKLCSSLTLFEQVAGPGSNFSQALEKYYSGRRDPGTLRLLGVGK